MSRYIDADAFVEWLKMARKMLTNDGERSLITGTKVSELVNNFPTADVQEVRHGRWEEIIEHRGAGGILGGRDVCVGYACSVCGRQADYRTPYCPNCGAKMVSALVED